MFSSAEKGDALITAIDRDADPRKFVSDPAAFVAMPGGPFSYWASPKVLGLFQTTEPFESNGRTVKGGMKTQGDFRFLRLAWELPPTTKSPWVPLCKGGSFSKFYFDLYLCAKWGDVGEEPRAYYEHISCDASWGGFGRNETDYFRPGITWPRRTNGLSFRALPAGTIFGDKGPAAFSGNDSGNELLALLAVMNSAPFGLLVALQLARVDLAQSFEVGIIQRTPFPRLDGETANKLGGYSRTEWLEKLRLDTANETSHAFKLPSLLAVPGSTLANRATAWAARVHTSEETIGAIQTKIDDLAFHLYGLDATDRAAVTGTLSIKSTDAAADFGEDEEEDEGPASAAVPAHATDLLAYAFGLAFGRWDLRFATGEKPAPPEPDPFDPLPVCPPGMLQNADGLPATPADVPADYPLRISWPGILVDDKGHDEDIETRVREVLAVVFPERVDEIAHEACGILGVKTLREFFRKPAAFFAGHLKRHSKSRRQAPIYWPISSPNGLYTLWLYYPRLTADTLFSALRDFLEPKLQYEEGRAFRLRQDAGPTPAPSQRAEIAEADELVDDLRALRDELKRVAPLFKPDLNDGVILNHAPLWRMIGLPKWRKDCQATWEKLAAGDYDWAHLALHLWPERVIPKCATDRSLAIAHDLESTFWEEIPADELPTNQRGRTAKKTAKKKAKANAGADDDAYALGADGDGAGDSDNDTAPTTGTNKWRQQKVDQKDLQQLITTRTSPAVKAALDALSTAPISGGAKKKAQKGGRA